MVRPLNNTLNLLFFCGVLLTPLPGTASPLSHFLTVESTDFQSVGAGGLRGSGTTDLIVGSLTGSVQQAFLVWHGPTNAGPDGPISKITLNDNPVTGQHIGASDDNSWNMSNSHAYLADVTEIVRGNGTYTFAGPSSRMANGASLLVFYNDGNPANDRDMLLFVGNDSNMQNRYDPLGWYFGAVGVGFGEGRTTVQVHVSDGQDFGRTDDGTLRLNRQELATGGIFQGRTVQGNSRTSVRNGYLWDIIDYDVTDLLGEDDREIILEFGSVSDALSLVAVVIDLPNGAAKRLLPVGPKTVIHEGRAATVQSN